MKHRLTESEKLKIKQLANRLKSLRIKAGYSNYEYFAYENEISRTQYGRYEQGVDLKFSTILRILKPLNITLEEFFSEGIKK